MVLLIAGCSHTGKTALAQKLLEKYKYPYLCLDHLKMGLIRSGNTSLTPEDDTALTDYLWPITKEIMKTVIENKQNLIIEGCYIPFDWKKDFSQLYLANIRYTCLVMSEKYIETHYSQIRGYANIIEKRADNACCNKKALIAENAANLMKCKQFGCDYTLIDEKYETEITL